ncbi:P-selectin-like isoform X2 [Heterodontus francisci]|uniref:P-selectin-like isoform X2 n=1 Tax=Heterodontus francisci TaxID=7792 RepID=UPI00355BDBEC
MVSHGGMICPCRRWPQVQSNIFRLLALVAVTFEILMLEGAHGWLYHYSDKAMTWNKARKYCKDYYTDMVAIQNMEENKHLNEYLPKASTHVWIGLRKIKNIWTWIGTNRTLEDFAMNWAPGEPNNGKNNEDCVEMYIKRNLYAGKWNDEPCRKKKRPLCYQASCNPDSCNGHGECVETIGDYKCDCDEGFYGDHCENVIKCLRLEIPDQGIMNCSHPYGNFSYRSMCDLSCVEGYEIREEKRLQCTASADWTAPLPECKAKRCRWLEVSSKDVMNCSHPLGYFSYNSTCTFGCREGYVLHGPDRVQCLASGQWTERTPTCKVQVCEILTVPDYGNMSCIHPIAGFHYNSTCDFSCNKGFALSGLSRLQCKVSGQWTAQKPICEAVKCSELKIPHSLLMNCSDPFRPFSYNSTCDFVCTDGFILQGSDRLQCEASGQWTATTPICKAVQCNLLKMPKRGIMNCRNPFGNYSYNSTCVFSCSEGYVLQGSGNLQCQASGQWTAQVPACEAAKCTRLENPEKGTINCSQPFGPFRYNATCDFRCEEGFILNGSDRVQCGASGKWTTQIPSCEVIKCEPLTQPAHGAMNCSHPFGNFSYSSMCDFWCSEGFLLSGTNWLECDISGQWTAKTPICKVATCQALTQPERGLIDCTHPIGDFSYNSTCDFDCTEGFVLQGSDKLQCQANGQWTAETPSCKAVTCQTLTQPERGAMSCSHPIGDFSYTSTCDFSCDEGFELNRSGRLQCQANGLWTAHIPSCKVVNCQTLTQPEQGAMNCSHPIGDFSYSSTCDFSCNEGFVLHGSDRIQCQANKQWTAQTPNCKATKCDVLRSPDRGTYNCSHPFGDFSYSSLCDFTCAEGFILTGSDSLECGASGNWTAQTPICTVATCQALTQPERGLIDCTHPIGDFSYNSTCDFDCTEGFVLQGSDKLQCQANGQWTAETPSCKAVTCQTLTQPERGAMSCSHPIGDFSYTSTCDFSCDEGFELNRSGRLQCQANGLWTAHIPSCKVVNCQTLTQPEQGAMNCSHPIGDFNYSSTCDFSCNEGFVLHGSDRIQCQANKQWTAQTPNCKAVKCNILKSLHHGTMSCSHPTGDFSYQSMCDLGCAEGFILNGTDKLECTALGTWTNKMPACEVVKCQELNIYRPAIMNCSHPLGNFSYSSVCDFDCVKGFTLERPVRLQCNESGQWTEEIPSCNVLAGLPPAASFLIYTSGVAAAIILALVIGATVAWIKKKLKKKDDTKGLNSDSSESTEDMFENPVFTNTPAEISRRT